MPAHLRLHARLHRRLRDRALDLVGRTARAAHALVSHVVYGDVLVLLRLPSPAADRSFLADVPGMTMRFLTADEVRAFASAGGTDLHKPYLAQALARGDRCFAILDGDRLASYSWYAEGPTGVTQELELNFPRPHIYMHHSYTHEAYRGRRLHTIGIVRALAELERGRPVTLLAIVSTGNPASLKSCQRAGYRPLGHFWLLGSANHLGVYSSRGARAHNCQLVPRRGDFGFLALPAAHVPLAP